jgi:superfamily II DNA or RNA helicase
MKVVDMANEGIHLKGVKLLVFARKTVSGNVFIQQLGRAMRAFDTGTRPLILDLVKNYSNIKVVKESVQSYTEVRHYARSKGDASSDTEEENVVPVTQVLISYDDVLLDLEDILAKVTNKWSDADDALLTEYYSKEGSEVYRRFKDKTKEECIKRARVLGLTRSRGWSAEEDEIIRQNYKNNKSSIWELLPGRTQAAIDRRADKLGLLDKWTPEEDLLLMKKWETEGLAMHTDLPRHSFKEIIERAKKFGLSMKNL